MNSITEPRKRNAGMSVLLGRLLRRLSRGSQSAAPAPAWQPEASRFTLETLDPLIRSRLRCRSGSRPALARI
jgi:hypothetical protein